MIVNASGVNTHLPAILMFTRATRFWPKAISRWSNCVVISTARPCDLPERATSVRANQDDDDDNDDYDDYGDENDDDGDYDGDDGHDGDDDHDDDDDGDDDDHETCKFLDKNRHGIDKFYQPNAGLRGSRR